MKRGIAWLTALVMALALTACTQMAQPGDTAQSDNGGGTQPAPAEPDAGYSTGGGEIVQLNGFRSIDIEWVNGAVSVELYDGEGIELTETAMDGGPASQKMEWRVDEDDSTLDIRSQPQLVSLSEEKRLTVRLPRSMVLYELDIDTVSADVSVDLTEEDTLMLTELDVTSVSGAVSVNAANAGEISLSTTSGDISGSVRTQKLEADSVSGAVELTLDTLPVELEMETTSGGILLKVAEGILPASGLRIDFRTTSGAFVCTAPYTEVRDGGWEFDTVSGSLDIRTVQ